MGKWNGQLPKVRSVTGWSNCIAAQKGIQPVNQPLGSRFRGIGRIKLFARCGPPTCVSRSVDD